MLRKRSDSVPPSGRTDWGRKRKRAGDIVRQQSKQAKENGVREAACGGKAAERRNSSGRSRSNIGEERSSTELCGTSNWGMDAERGSAESGEEAETEPAEEDPTWGDPLLGAADVEGKKDQEAEAANGRAEEERKRAGEKDMKLAEADMRAAGSDKRAKEADKRADEADERAKKAKAASARAEEANARAEKADARAEDASARAEAAIARAEIASARAEDAHARAEEAIDRAKTADARAADAERAFAAQATRMRRADELTRELADIARSTEKEKHSDKESRGKEDLPLQRAHDGERSKGRPSENKDKKAKNEGKKLDTDWENFWNKGNSR
ncbi:hypothetical protein KFL_001340200 [Klebsormidium nitens]|uniref:Uncharacterized protein n=1 Tax=Klebsormidium nitens TaxID=105231 RepID=A0A1Y1HWQ1_KLENI|nr:hypothetical protein KFL_001340200 [Klebsormidium nitens]|eukprot:GAQ83065.1 hypothetical protein KFL_001340200 [Klebsormidium nitens]